MIVTVLIFLLASIGGQAACLPDSTEISKMDVTSAEIRVIEDSVVRFETIMLRKLPTDHDIAIRLDSLNPRVNAEVVKENGLVAIVVWGGMISHPKMSAPTFYLLLCHELGHFLGGPPLKSRNGWSSTEGQSDYYSSINCVKDLGLDEAQFIDASLALTSIYAEVTNQSPPRLDTCDESVATRTNYGYPSIQCRLDTLLAGWNETARPKCWFFE